MIKEEPLIVFLNDILNKAIVRGGWNTNMADYLRELYKDYQELTNQTLPSLPDSADFAFMKELYKNIEPLADASQQKALKKLTEYSLLVERLYS